MDMMQTAFAFVGIVAFVGAIYSGMQYVVGVIDSRTGNETDWKPWLVAFCICLPLAGVCFSLAAGDGKTCWNVGPSAQVTDEASCIAHGGEVRIMK
jgi:hypothetical protein